MNEKWRAFAGRIEDRCILTLDVLSILVFDGVIVVLGYVITHLVVKLSDPADAFFSTVRHISQGLFLLLYMVYIGKHLLQLLKEGKGSGREV